MRPTMWGLKLPGVFALCLAFMFEDDRRQTAVRTHLARFRAKTAVQIGITLLDIVY